MTTNDAQLVEMERMMRSAPEPGGLAGVSMGEDVGVTGTSVTSAGHAIMWNTDSREPSVFNMNSVRAKLREVFPDDYSENPEMAGKPCWTASAPATLPWRGKATCPLHKSRPEREAYDQIGFPRCSRVELPSEMDAQEHLRLKHPRTWSLMQTQRGEVERIAQEEDRVLNRKILEHLAGVAPMVAPEPAVVIEPTEVTIYTESSTTAFTGGISIDADIPKHAHQYPKTMGSPCKTAGCPEVRTTEFKSRNKK